MTIHLINPGYQRPAIYTVRHPHTGFDLGRIITSEDGLVHLCLDNTRWTDLAQMSADLRALSFAAAHLIVTQPHPGEKHTIHMKGGAS